MPGVLITNNANTHPPATWAVASAQMIFDVNDDAAADRRIEAMKLQTAIAEYLVSHHDTIQTREQEHLDRDAEARFATGHDVHDDAHAATDGIIALARNTPFAAAFQQPGMRAKIVATLGSHFATAQHIHRQAHAHANPEHPAGQKFMAKVHGWTNPEEGV